MGNRQARGGSTGPEDPRFREALSTFSPNELEMVRGTFKDLALRSPGRVIDKATFLRFFPLPGLLGERLFKVFDRKNTGAVDFEEFVCGLSASLKGTSAVKTRALRFI